MPSTLEQLGGKPVARMTEVVARLRAIERALPPGDGVAAFARLYRAVTEAVGASAAEFEDERTLRWLDVVFANEFFAALSKPPRAWRPLLEARGRRGIHPLQFALAGMNAHINRDLPVALVETCVARDLALRRNSPQQRDFRRVDALLRETEARVKRDFLRGPFALADDALGRLDDVVAMWNVERARDAAWRNAEVLWALRPSKRVADDFVRTLDRMVGFASRGLLRPIIPA